MAKSRKSSAHSVSASEFRSHLFEHLGVAASGTPVSIRYKGEEFQLSAVKPQGKLERFYSSGKPEPVIGDPEDKLFSDDPSLIQDREDEWIEKWNRRIKGK